MKKIYLLIMLCASASVSFAQLKLCQRDADNVIINANEFAAGMYLYSLVCDGKIVDTKQMLLTE